AFHGEQGDDRGAHAPLLGVVLRGLVDAQVAQLDPGDQAVFLVRLGPVHLVGPGAVRVVAGGGEELLQGVDGQLRGHLAGGVAAHAVGDDVEAILREDGEVVLVVGSLTTDVGLTGYFDAQGRLTSCEGPQENPRGGETSTERSADQGTILDNQPGDVNSLRWGTGSSRTFSAEQKIAARRA